MNAIILAAGTGERLRPLTLTTPKCLLPVKGTPILEKQISILREMGIHEITVVTGYLHHKMEYLKEKYKIDLIYNEKYETLNNLYSMYLVRDRIGDTVVLEGDIYFEHHILENKNGSYKKPACSVYWGIHKVISETEWILKANENNILTKIIPQTTSTDVKKLCMSGISYWTKQDGKVIRNLLTEYIHTNPNNYWDSIVKDNLNLFYIKVQTIENLFEIDTLSDYRKIFNPPLI